MDPGSLSLKSFHMLSPIYLVIPSEAFFKSSFLFSEIPQNAVLSLFCQDAITMGHDYD